MLFRIFSLTLLAGCFLSSLSLADRPNIVVILCDDLGYGDLQCYGHPHITTPNLDRLADEGIRLTDCYSAAPVCSPSRVGLLTGRSPNRAGVYDWIPEARRATPDRRQLVHMRRSETTIPHVLKGAGYQTCMVGKWHCNSEFNKPVQPQPGDFAFDHWMATQNNAAPSHERPRNFVRNGVEVGEVDAFSCQYVVDEAIRWLEQADDERPFFLYVAFHEPHEPVASPQNLVDRYRDVARNDDEAQYFANVANVDLAVGKLLDELERSQRADNTLVIFTSDNGPETLNRYRNANRSYGRPGPLRGMKLHTTDAGFRVAGIIRWRDRINEPLAGSTSDSPVSSLDFLPTFCRLAGIDPPKDVVLDGTDISPLFDGQPVTRAQPLVWAYYNALNEARVAMRDGKWKVLAKLNGGQLPKMSNVTRANYPQIRDAKVTDVEVYDISEDIHEDHNLAESRPELGKQLGDKLRARYRELVDDSHTW